MKLTLKQLREKAKRLIAKGKYAWRSCWKCNGAHEHLKESPYVINCFECGHWYYKGKDITKKRYN